MQILLNTDHNTDGRHEMADHLETVVKNALDRFGESITRVEAYLSDANSSAKSAPDDIHCTLDARLAGMEPIIVKDHAPTAHQAIHGAVGKLKRAVLAVHSKHSPRHNAATADVIDPDATADFPA